MTNKYVEIIGYLVHVKGTRTGNGKYMSFGVFIDLEGHWIDTVQFPNITAQYPFRGPGCYLIKGKVVSEFSFISIEVSSRKDSKSRRIDELMGKLNTGDTLIVTELSRLGRSVGELATIIDTLVDNKIRFIL